MNKTSQRPNLLSSAPPEDPKDLTRKAWTKSPERAEIDKLERVIWGGLDTTQQAFWQAYVLRIAVAHSLVRGSRSSGQWLRLSGLAMSAAVPAIAAIQGNSARIAIATVGAAAVTLNGAALVFHVDPRLSINRRYKAEMLDAGWRLATKGTVSVEDGTAGSSSASPAAFEQFKSEVDGLRQAYTSDYMKDVDTSPGNAAE